MRRGVPFCDRRSQNGTPRRPWRRGTRRLSVGVVRSAGGPGATPGGELVGGVAVVRGLGGALAGQLRERPLDLAPDTTDRDAEDALPALQQVDDLVVAGALVDRGAVAH